MSPWYINRKQSPANSECLLVEIGTEIMSLEWELIRIKIQRTVTKHDGKIIGQPVSPLFFRNPLYIVMPSAPGSLSGIIYFTFKVRWMSGIINLIFFYFRFFDFRTARSISNLQTWWWKNFLQIKDRALHGSNLVWSKKCQNEWNKMIGNPRSRFSCLPWDTRAIFKYAYYI